MHTSLNPELLKAYFEPLVHQLVEERVSQIVKEKMEKLKLSMEPEKPILMDKACEILGYSRSHIYMLCRTNQIPHIKKGRWLYFYVSELNEWLREG